MWLLSILKPNQPTKTNFFITFILHFLISAYSLIPWRIIQVHGGSPGSERLSPPFTPSKSSDLSDPFASAPALPTSVTPHSRCSMKCSTGTAPLLKWKLRSPHSVDGCMTLQVPVPFNLRPFSESRKKKKMCFWYLKLLWNLVLILPFPGQWTSPPFVKLEVQKIPNPHFF